MGSFFTKILSSIGLTVECVEVGTAAELRREMLARARCVLVSVPISSSESVIKGLIGEISPDALLADLTSVKEMPLRAMSAHVGEVLGLHPMCGPVPGGLRGQTIVVCRSRAGSRAAALCQVLESCGAVLKDMSAEEHDRLMAVVQGMNHFHSIVFAHAMKALKVPIDQTMEVASPVYRIRMQLMGRILAQDPSLYADIHLYNPYVLPALKEFMNSAGQFFQEISNGSRSGCMDFFNQAATAMGSYGAAALRESDLLIEQVARSSNRTSSDKVSS